MANLLANFDGTGLLSAHTTDSGHTATTGTNHTLTGTGAVYCNTAALSDPAFDGLALPPVGDTDVIVRFHNASSSTNTQGVVFASTASETGYLLQIQGNSPATVSFWKLGGTGAGFKHTSSGYQTIPTGEDSLFYKAEIRAADIKIYSASTVDGLYTLRYTLTDTEHRGTDVRLRSGAISTASTGKHLDYLSVTEIVPPIPDPPPWPDGTYDVSWSANGGADTASSTLYVGDIFEYASPTFALRSAQITSEPASLVHDTDAVFESTGFATAPTTGNTTLTNGTEVLTPSSVTGSGPYTITFPISRLDRQEGSYVWTLSIDGQTLDTSSLAYTIDGNGTSEYYGTVAALTGVWAEPEYSALAIGDNIYAIRTAGTGAADVTVGAFPESTTWTIYIQDQADDVWGASGVLTIPAAAIAPTMPADTTVNVNENTTAVGTFAATAGAPAPSYILSGTDAASFNINSSTALVAFNVAPDYETKNSYSFIVTATNSEGSDTQTVTVSIVDIDEVIPVITLLGSSVVTHEALSTYTDAGATATDNVDGDLTGSIVVTNNVNAAVVGSYTVLYDVDDAAGNSAIQGSRTVNVVDTTAPVITVTGSTTVNHALGDVYTDAGATATDAYDGNITGNIVTTNPVNVNIEDTYLVLYNVQDANGNAATQQSRTVVVAPAPDVTAPILSSPTATNIGSYAASGSATTDEANGILHYVASTNASESAGTVQAGTNNVPVTTTGAQAVSISGLADNTLYYLHFVHEDNAGNLSNVVSSSSFTTDEATGGGFISYEAWMESLPAGSWTSKLRGFLESQGLSGSTTRMLYTYLKSVSSGTSHNERKEDWKDGGWN